MSDPMTPEGFAEIRDSLSRWGWLARNEAVDLLAEVDRLGAELAQVGGLLDWVENELDYTRDDRDHAITRASKVATRVHQAKTERDALRERVLAELPEIAVAEWHADSELLDLVKRVRTAVQDDSPTSKAATPDISDAWLPSENCYCGGPEEIYPHRFGTALRCKGSAGKLNAPPVGSRLGHQPKHPTRVGSAEAVTSDG